MEVDFALPAWAIVVGGILLYAVVASVVAGIFLRCVLHATPEGGEQQKVDAGAVAVAGIFWPATLPLVALFALAVFVSTVGSQKKGREAERGG